MENEDNASQAAAPGVAAAAPWHLWVVGVLALLFTLYGGYDYYMSQIGDRAYIAAAVEPFGIDADVAVEYFSTFPLWADVFWALGVWSAVAGSVLLLLRSRFAFPAYVLSLVGLVVSNAYSYSNPIPGMTDSAMTLVVVAVVVIVMVLLTIYARRMVAKGVLR